MRALDEISIQYVKGVGPVKRGLFEQLGVKTVEDLLYFFPRRYEDRSHLVPIPQLKIGEFQTVRARVMAKGIRRSWFTKKSVFEVVVDDGKGRLFCVYFNQGYLESYFKLGCEVVLYGKVELYKDRIQMISPEYEILGKEEDQETLNLNVGRIVPIYSLTKGMSQRYLRKVVRFCLDRFKEELNDVLPVTLRNKYRLANIRRSIENIHYPGNLDDQRQAYDRVAFEEFFLFQVSVFKRRLSIVTQKGICHRISKGLFEQFSQNLPFALTQAQKKVIQEISGDLEKETPMLRLLQGDVGSGKTLVAFWGCLVAWKNGYQSSVMAPTEILAKQHYDFIQRLSLSGPMRGIRVSLLIGQLSKQEKERGLQQIQDGEVDVVIGTHALLMEDVGFKRLSFVVIDEQHKFGVRQRALLSSKGLNPDVLIMTATPIPRTLQMTLFGDLDVSIIDELPPGRGVIQTQFFSTERSAEAYAFVQEMVPQGQQVYIVYPIIEESDKLELKSVEKMYRHFRQNEFKSFHLGLIHGQMPKQEADAVMQRFKNKEIDILLATTVLEVGIDVPNASVIIIEHAERFGLSQLHQLRGRVGRGQGKGYCLLLGDPTTEDGKARLKAVLSTQDGFQIAEMDLMIRGPGQFFGRHQHGLGEFKMADPTSQIKILEIARKEALTLVEQDPELTQDNHMIIKEMILKRYPNYLAMTKAG